MFAYYSFFVCRDSVINNFTLFGRIENSVEVLCNVGYEKIIIIILQ